MDKTMQDHWDTVYGTKTPSQVSWTQEVPQTSLDFIHSFGLPKSAGIIDIGGGDSKLADHLLAEGFENITVLDISAKALDRAKQRLGKQAEKVKWIVRDIMEFKPDTTYDIWHDRAAFHFLTSRQQVEKYVEIARSSVTGYLVISTFSDQGPAKCSGLTIKQYTTQLLSAEFASGFEKLSCITEDHVTPFNTLQNFLFCSFKRTT